MSASNVYKWLFGAFEKRTPEWKTKTQRTTRSLWNSKLRTHVRLATRLDCHWSSVFSSKGEDLTFNCT